MENIISYRLPAARGSRSLFFGLVLILIALASLPAAVGLVATHHTPLLVAIVSGLGLLFGANTVTYETPVIGVTAPTAAQSRTHQMVSAVITGDGAAVAFTLTHNWHLTTADLAAGYPAVELEYLLAAGYTAAALITSKGTDTVVFSNTVFTGAGLRVRLLRPWSAMR
jgi:hypothetical protein